MEKLEKIISDLEAEYRRFDDLLTGLNHRQWELETRFYGWTIFDEAAHIAFFDHEALLAAENPRLFRQRSVRVMEIIRTASHWPEHFNAMLGEKHPSGLLENWRKCRKRLLTALSELGAGDRLPWYGPDLSVASFATARLMETWAHSQDVRDLLGKRRINGPELFHIARLGVSTFAWSFKIRGLTPPELIPRIELTAPSGETWAWGSPDACSRIWGTARDFCLVVTQRRNFRETGLNWQGPHVAEWLSIAQAFAGIPQNPPVPGKEYKDKPDKGQDQKP
ncbi:MAG: TIGR03084 family metal-binding protein [Desulfobacterales bacterium]|nr:TIGR03084 family metal-binding protein [Desulfobacterales bacterium]